MDVTLPNEMILASYIDQKSVGDNFILTVYRNGHVIDLKARLAVGPSLLPFLAERFSPPNPSLSNATPDNTIAIISFVQSRKNVAH